MSRYKIGNRMTTGTTAPAGAVTFNDISVPLQPIAHDISSQVKAVQPIWHIEATLKGNDEYALKIPKITSISIHEGFEANVCDFINLAVMVPISEMRTLEKLYKGLKCQLDFYSADPNQGLISSKPAYSIKWFAIFSNRGSIFRNATPAQLNSISGAQIDKQQTVEVKFTLYNPGASELRNKKTAGVFRDTNVTDMIHWVASRFGVTTIDMRPAQNTEEYENFILEPMHNMNDIFDYIQYRYGIYQYGLSVYYYGLSETSSTLFMYPPFMFDPPISPTDQQVEIIYVGQRQLQSGCSTSKEYPKTGYQIEFNGKTINVTGGLKILCSNIVDQVSPGDFGADSTGTISITFNANRIVDRWRTIKQDSQYRCIPQHKKTGIVDGMVDVPDLRGFAEKQYNPRYDVSYNNGRIITSELARSNCDVITLRWTGAKPWSLQPGKRIVFTYGEDSNESVTQVPGLCSEIAYGFTPVKGNEPGVDYFECFADIILKLKRNK